MTFSITGTVPVDCMMDGAFGIELADDEIALDDVSAGEVPLTAFLLGGDSIVPEL